MCNFFSAIITKDGIIYDPQTDAHEDLIKKAGLDDTTMKPDFVRIEVNPKDSDIFNHDLDNWQFKVDQDLLPDWWTDDFVKMAEERAKKALQDVFSKIFFINVKDVVIKNQRGFLKNSSVEARKNSSVVARNNSSVVARDNSSVEAWNNSSVVAWNNSSVVARENSSVVAWDNSSVVAWNNSSVVAWNNSSVVAWDNSSVEAWDNSSVEAWDNSSVNIPYSTSINIKSVQDKASVIDLSGNKPKLIVAKKDTFDIVEFKKD